MKNLRLRLNNRISYEDKQHLTIIVFIPLEISELLRIIHISGAVAQACDCKYDGCAFDVNSEEWIIIYSFLRSDTKAKTLAFNSANTVCVRLK